MSTFGYSKMAQNAIAAVSFLAAKYDDPLCRCSSAQIAEARDLPQALVAKVLTRLSQANFVTGSPGPNGGYRLVRAPQEITFYDIVSHFDPVNDTFPCPFGVDYCSNKNPCPLHDELVAMRESVDRFLKSAHFAGFASTEDGYSAS